MTIRIIVAILIAAGLIAIAINATPNKESMCIEVVAEETFYTIEDPGEHGNPEKPTVLSEAIYEHTAAVQCE